MEFLSGRVRSSITQNREWQVTIWYTLQRCVALPIRDLNLGANWERKPSTLPWCEARYKVLVNHCVSPRPRTPTLYCSSDLGSSPVSISIVYHPTSTNIPAGQRTPFLGTIRPRYLRRSSATHHRSHYRGDLGVPHPLRLSLGIQLTTVSASVDEEEKETQLTTPSHPRSYG
jgi:hypothetical protein